LPSWDIPRTKAKHSALISLKTFDKIQVKLRRIGTSITEIRDKIEVNTNRIDRSEDFPLRGFLFCEISHAPLT